MAWSAPLTAVTNAVFTAAQYNAAVRDNLLETAPAKATGANGWFVSTGANSLVQRTPATAFNTAAGDTTSTTFTSTLTGTPGTNPSVTVTTGTHAIVYLTCQAYCWAGPDTWAIMGYSVSGATTIAATDDSMWGWKQNQNDIGQQAQFTRERLLTSLTPGSNTFTLAYRTTAGGTAQFRRRSITVVPL